MSDINSFSDYSSKYNTNVDNSGLFAGLSQNSAPAGSSFNLNDYASIKNGSYGKLLKVHYARQKAESKQGQGDSSKRLLLMKTSADGLKKSADALSDASLWEKKMIKKKDEITGEEKEVSDYDWKAITKAVKSFISDYNNVVEETGKSDTKGVLRNAAWMTGMTGRSESLLAKIGITVGKGNKLELDEETLKESHISTLKSVFTGSNSFSNKVAQKAGSIGNEASRAKGNTYTYKGNYSDAFSELVSGKLDKEI